jgi:hypothetical protein
MKDGFTPSRGAARSLTVPGFPRLPQVREEYGHIAASWNLSDNSDSNANRDTGSCNCYTRRFGSLPQQSQPVIDFVTYVTFPGKQPSYPECDAVLIVPLDRVRHGGRRLCIN